nr:MAG TPA: hypothetical protein [Bacteriophage sp.]
MSVVGEILQMQPVKFDKTYSLDTSSLDKST